ncbi:DUF2254 domain-containing protein [Micromonospora halophytica]|uniref:DUF2254 domain-containing protein n=1 Tax=Micromonospora halophytica TaxID=47864 RepID=UPI001480D19B|nr:DUF2254 domain-containing protein [Micromonospora halophytica]
MRGSFWLVPAVFAVSAVVLAVGLSVLELRLALPIGGILPSGPAGARSLLSSIITAMISFTALVFSITVVALQLASSQYSPRVLRTFLQDRVIQITLGTFVATFLFAMVVLAALPDRAAGRLPELSLAASMALVLCSTAVFIYYLHHITTVMRVSHIIAAIGVQTRRCLDADRSGDEGDEGDGEPEHAGQICQVIGALGPGMIVDVDVDLLAEIARRHRCAISVVPVPGDFVAEGAPLLHVHPVGDQPPAPLDPGDTVQGVSISVERTPGQDIGFGLRQLADIAERALSPGINDVTTAERAVREAHDLLRRLAVRPRLPRVVHDDDGTVRAVARRQSFDSLLAVAVDDVAYAGRDQPRITRALVEMLRDLTTVALPEHLPAVRRRLAEMTP